MLTAVSGRRKTKKKTRRTANASWSWRRRSSWGRRRTPGARAWQTTKRTRRSIWRT
jgi:hypothetical protein